MNRSVLSFPILALSTLLFASPAVPERPRNAQCDVASAYVTSVLAQSGSQSGNRRLVFSTETARSEKLSGYGGWIDRKSNKLGKRPPKSLISRLGYSFHKSAVSSCASVRELLHRHSIAYGASAVDAVMQSSSSRMSTKYDAEIVAVTVPIISENGREALLISSSMSGLLAAGSFIQYLERSDSGEWSVVSWRTLTVA